MKLGQKHTLTSIKKMSASHSKNPSRYWLGKKRSLETIKKMGINRKGKGTGKRSSQWRANISKGKTGIKFSDTHIRNLSLSHRKGEDLKYSALHIWVRRNLGSPPRCENCNFFSNSNRKIHWANRSGEYKKELTDWIRLCVPCHSNFDRNRKNV